MLPSDQIISEWALDSINVMNWMPLEKLIFDGLVKNWSKHSEEECSNLAEERLKYVMEHLRNRSALAKEDGEFFPYEVDLNDLYLKRTEDINRVDLKYIRKMDPFAFESLCSEIICKIGGNCSVTKKSNDGGVDFYALNVRFVQENVPFPAHCKIAVVGQAIKI